MKRTNGQKAERILTFLMGLRSLKALEPMARYGLGPTDVEEGWQLLRGMASYPFEQAKRPGDDTNYVALVDAWENHWFSIIERSLTRNFPDVRAQVFEGLRQLSGPEVLRSVRVLIDRIEALRQGPERSRAAFALLQRRGLDDSTLVEVRALLGSADRRSPPEAVTEPSFDRDAAEDAAWAWYLEWSAIAQKAIADRRMLRELGYLGHRPLPPESEAT